MESDIPSIPSPAAFDLHSAQSGNGNAGESGVTTHTQRGDESGWSSLAEVPDERKAQVLRRHLVSAEERGSKAGTPGMSPGDSSPMKDTEMGRPGSSTAGAGAGVGAAGGPGDSAVTYGSTSDSQADDQFPIPFDAPGGDVT